MDKAGKPRTIMSRWTDDLLTLLPPVHLEVPGAVAACSLDILYSSSVADPDGSRSSLVQGVC